MNKKWIGIISAIMGVMLAFLVFGGTAKADGEASHTDHEGWTAVTALPAAEAGTEKVYLTADITQTSSYTLAAGQNLVICLNGHNITGNMTTNLFEAVDGSSITICNCGAHDDTHGVVNGSSKVNNIVNIEKKTGAVVGVTVDNVTLQNAKAAVFCNDGSSPAATVTVNRAKLQGFTYIGMYMRGSRTVCEITGNTEIIGSSSATREFYLGGDTSTCHFRSGVIKNMVQGAVAIAGSAKFNMYDGASIVDCVNTSNNSGNGAAVRINNYANSIFTMYGGRIDNCSGKCGGAVYVKEGKFDMQGGEITNCTATGTTASTGGGAVFVNNGTFSMSGGKIQDCETKWDRGGAVFASVSTVNISGTALIGGEGHANKINMNQTNGGYGAGIHCYASTFKMTGGEISYHEVVYGGANLSLFENADKGSVASITGGTIKNGTLAASNTNHMGANICVYGASQLAIGSTSEENKPVISGGVNTASGGLGGNIGLRNYASLTLTGYSEISGGTALYGGNIYTESAGTVIVTGHPDIKNGTAPNGSNLYIKKNTDVSITNATLGDGEFTIAGGSLTMENTRVGDMVLAGGTVHFKENRFNSVTAPQSGLHGVLTDGYYKAEPDASLLKGSGTITAGTYLIGGETYNYKIETTFSLLAPTEVTYRLNNDTDGFAGGLLTLTLPTYEENIVFDFEMYWGNAQGKLPGYTRLPLFQATGVTTNYIMNSESLIPTGATTLIIYTVERSTGDKCETPYVLELPAGAASVEPAGPYKEFQVMSDVHIDNSSNAANFTIHREHFNMMLNDIAENSPNSIGMFIVGDIANSGAESEYQLVHQMHDAVDGVPTMYWSIGNHDLWNHDQDMQVINDLFCRYADLPDGGHPDDTCYDFWLEGYHFIFLGTDYYNDLTAIFADETYEWLDETLQENRDQSRPIFLFLHQSIFNTVAGCMEGQWEKGVDRETSIQLAAVLKKYPEIVFFNGHSHYELTLPNDHYKPTEDLPINIFNTSAVAYISTDYGDYGNSHREVGSQGFYVRVYEDRIRVYGHNFETGEWVPSAMYELNLLDRTPHEDPVLPAPTGEHVHCVCGAEHTSYLAGHGTEELGFFTPVNESTGLPTPAKNHKDYVYLTSDITLSQTYLLAGGQKLYICLNGHTIRGTGSNRLFLLSDEQDLAQLVITDCSADHTGTLDACNSADTPYNTETYMDIDGNVLSNVGGGQIIAVVSSGGNSNKIRLFNITLQNGYVKHTGGGAIRTSGPGSSLYNVTIRNCSSGTISGGAVYTNGARSTFFYNCLIENCSARKGGAIYGSNANTRTVLIDTEISNCSATHGGGAVGSSGYIAVFGNTYIHDCSCIVDGGALWSDTHINIYGGKFVRNKAETVNSTRSGGGAIFCHGDLFIKDCLIGGSEADKNTASSQGGAILQENGTFKMKGGEISYNVGAHGGNIVLQSGAKAVITGGTIACGASSNTVSNNYAGNIGIYTAGTSLLLGGDTKIFGGTGAYGANVLMRDNVTLTIEGNVLIADGNSSNYGSNLCANAGTLTVNGGYIQSLYVDSATATLNGGYYIDEPDGGTLPADHIFVKGTFANPDPTDGRTYRYTPGALADLPAFAPTISAEVGESFALRFKALPGTIEGAEVLLQLTKHGVALDPIPMTLDGDGNFVALYSLDPDDLTEDLQPTLLNGETVLQEKGTYRAVNYIKAVAMAVTDAKIRTLLADLLEYGAAAQVYYDHNADNLANAEAYRWEGYQPSEYTAPANVPELNYQSGSSEVTISSANLWLENDTVTIQIKGTAPADAEFTLNGIAAVPEMTGENFKLRTEAIMMSELADKVVTAVVSKGGVTSTVTYGTASYVTRITATSTNEAMKTLAKRLWAYALSAKAAR